MTRKKKKFPPVPKTPEARAKISKTMREYKEGTLRSSSGQKVTSRRRAVAISLSQGRRAAQKKRRRSVRS